jgi:hypothetical protein
MTHGVALAVWLTVGQAGGGAALCPAAGDGARLSAATLPGALVTLARCAGTELDTGRWRSVDERLAAASRASVVIADAAGRTRWLALIARIAARRAVDAGQWSASATIVLPHEQALPWAGPLVRGLSSARAAWAQQDAALVAQARRELARLEALARDAGPVSEAEQARLIVQGAIAGAQYERDEMQLLMEAAGDLAARLDSGDELRPAVVLPREQQADLLRVTDRYAAAAELYLEVLVARPHRVQSRIGLADAYRRLGYTRESAVALEQARTLWAAADPDAAGLVR